MRCVPIFKWLELPLKTVAIPLGLLLNGAISLSAFMIKGGEGIEPDEIPESKQMELVNLV